MKNFQIMRAKEAAAYLGLSYWKLMELRKAGKVPFVDLDGLILFRKEALDAWLIEKEAASTNREDLPVPGKIRRLV
jgi:excisionase family DNA binding protein